MFKKLWFKIKSLFISFTRQDYRFYIGIGAILVSVILFLTLYKICFSRLIDSIKDLAISFVFYFLFLLRKDDLIIPTVNTIPYIDIQTYVPFSIDEVIRKFDVFPQVFFDIENFKAYLRFLLEKTSDLLRFFLLFILPFILICYVYFDKYTSDHVERKEGTKLERFVSFIRKSYSKVKAFVIKFFSYYKQHKWIYKLLIFIWLINTNVLTICLEFLAYYFYFVCSFEFITIGIQLKKLLYDSLIMLWTLPTLAWIIIGYLIFDYFRTEAAYKKLEHNERRNRGFINSLSIFSILVGRMRKGKTMAAVDMSLSMQIEIRERALLLLDNNMKRFPEFPFNLFEAELREKIKSEKIVNPYTAREYVRNLATAYSEDPVPDKIWGYDEQKYPHDYNTGLKMLNIWEALENYAHEYFVYSLSVSSIISSIAIRSDVQIIDKGYFEGFNNDFFRRKIEDQKDNSCFSHIIDWDLFRIGCQINKEKRVAGAFEFGVFTFPELGKERLNALEMQGLKKDACEANQRNDLFNSCLKFIGHNTTVEYTCLAAVFSDEQRPESIGADLRDLGDVIHIEDKSDTKLALRLSFISAIVDMSKKSYDKWYNKVKMYGNEDVFVVSLIHLIFSKLSQKAEYIDNTFGYYVQDLNVESGTDVSNGKSGTNMRLAKYFINKKKTLADRYSTDCNKGMFEKRTKDVALNIKKIETYQNVCASYDELKKQNSYLTKQFSVLFDE